jgi:hypothetical protein
MSNDRKNEVVLTQREYRMNRKRKLIITVSVSATVLIGILIAPPLLFPEIVEFHGEWVVSVGETYQFEIESWGEYNFGSYNESETDELLRLDGTVINVTITDLPILDFDIIKTTFENEIVAVQKISCIFSNGTEIPTRWLERISESISGCIIPVGSWLTLDAYHPTLNQIKEGDLGWKWHHIYFSELSDESFQFGSLTMGMDSSEIWNGTISLDRGLPSQVSWSYTHMFGPIEFELTIRS